MKGFDSRFIEELKNKNEIVDTVGRYVRLEQRGSSFWGKCPFHHEKTASFCVNGSEQFYYCFGCHKSGDVINFIMEMESLDFSDAVKLLAERAKMQLPDVKYDDEQIKEQKKRKERLLSLLRETALFYAHNLHTSAASQHIEYIIKRKITDEYALKFGLGASLDFNGLPQYLRSKGYTDEEMTASGACGEKNGRLYDSLGGRLIIPIINQFNEVIAFVGRVLVKTDFGKYVNTRETAVFSKGNTLFNLNNLKKLKNEKGLDSVIIVEGHLDVITLYQAGFKNVVASMGTALTKDQARILKRYTDKVYISYDGDFAGQKASVRGLEILKEEGLEVKVVALPDGMDPDDVIKNLGAEGYTKLLSEAMPLIDFKLDALRKTFDLKSVSGKRSFATAAVKVIKESPSAAEQEDLLKIVRDATGFTFEALKRELYNAETNASSPPPAVVPEFNETVGDKTALAARYVLYSFLFGKEFTADENVAELDFSFPAHKEFQSYIVGRKNNGEPVRFSDLYELYGDEYAKELSMIAGMETDDEKKFDREIYFIDCIKTLKLASLEKKLALLSDRFSAEKNSDERRAITTEMQKLLNERNKLI